MALAIFDLDHTLLDGDTDFLWNNFLCDRGWQDRSTFEARYATFNQRYDSGTLEAGDYCRALIDAVAHIETTQLLALRDQFATEIVPRHISDSALALIAEHRQRGDTLLVITASVRFLAECSRRCLPIEHFIATELEWTDNRPSNRIHGVASFREGKITRLNEWLQGRTESLQGSWFYSDSINDLALLELVDNPVSVNADTHLTEVAQARNWQQMQLRVQHSNT